MVSRPTQKTLAFWSHRSVTTHPYSCELILCESKDKLKSSESQTCTSSHHSYKNILGDLSRE
jgi:hypothetical protein